MKQRKGSGHCEVTAQLICAFVFADVKSMFSHDALLVFSCFLTYTSHIFMEKYPSTLISCITWHFSSTILMDMDTPPLKEDQQMPKSK